MKKGGRGKGTTPSDEGKKKSGKKNWFVLKQKLKKNRITLLPGPQKGRKGGA